MPVSKPQIFAEASSFHNPKRDKENRLGRSGWYQYYAGFSPRFVRDALDKSSARPGFDRLLDPWNGSGTTTEIGIREGFDSIGFDLNPVMVLVSKARTLQHNVQPSVKSLFEEIVLCAARVEQDFEDDPLTKWLSVETAASMRKIEFALQTVLVDAKNYSELATLPSLKSISALAAFFYVGLFKSLQQILLPFRSSNPTWIKRPANVRERIHVPRKDLVSILRAQIAEMAEDLAAEALWVQAERTPRVEVDVASSTCLPVGNNSIQIVVSSPPYCTRIDYVVKTGPELALLGMGDSAKVHNLRDRMIGTPTIAEQLPEPHKKWGKTCLTLIDKVSLHKSRASKSYYLKTKIQYFDGLYQSLVELNRVLANSGECFLVVQDSYYKEIHVDLAQIVREMGNSVGWHCDFSRDFASSRTMVGVNRGARAYRTPNLSVESVLHFVKAGSRERSASARRK